MRLIECVPNFSEGRNEKVINAIADSIRAVDGAKLLDVDPGWSTNRTVVTFVAEPEVALEAAFQAIATASKLIDMTKHSGEHPRMGATDVCPFVPVSEATMDDCVDLAHKLGKRVGEELKIPVYLYANAAKRADRGSLADIRKGEYEALPTKMKEDSFIPDYGPRQFNATAGATVIGARPFLIAYNINLNTRSKKLANEIAFNIREAGRVMKDAAGKPLKDASGNSLKRPGALKACRAVGWYVDEYERAQVSINLIDYKVTSLHQAFDECVRQAAEQGVRVTGSEIVGLVPLEPMLDAGRYYLHKQGRSTGVSEQELVTVAIQSLGLSDIAPFDRNAKIIEYKIGKEENLLREQSIVALTDELASDSPAPGGGSVSALCGALSASLCAMVANLTFEKKGFADKKPQMESLANKAQRLKSFFLLAIDEDSKAFNQIVNARKLPKSTIYEQLLREHAILEANMQAIKVPLSVLTASEELLELAAMAISDGNPNSLSDAGCAVLNAQACAEGAYMNVLINVPSLIHSGQAVQCSETSESSESSKSSAGLTSSELIAFKEKTLQTAGDAIEKIRSLAKQLSGDVFDKLAALTDID